MDASLALPTNGPVFVMMCKCFYGMRVIHVTNEKIPTWNGEKKLNKIITILDHRNGSGWFLDAKRSETKNEMETNSKHATPMDKWEKMVAAGLDEIRQTYTRSSRYMSELRLTHSAQLTAWTWEKHLSEWMCD